MVLLICICISQEQAQLENDSGLFSLILKMVKKCIIIWFLVYHIVGLSLLYKLCSALILSSFKSTLLEKYENG